MRNRHFQQELLLAGVASLSVVTILTMYVVACLALLFLVFVADGVAATRPLLGTAITLLGMTAVIVSLVLALRNMWCDLPTEPLALRTAAYVGFVGGVVLLIAVIIWFSTHPTPCVTPPSGLPPELPPCPPGATS